MTTDQEFTSRLFRNPSAADNTPTADTTPEPPADDNADDGQRFAALLFAKRTD